MNKLTLPSYEKLKADLEKPELTLWDYINYRGDFELAAAFCKLFWPDFIEVEGCILLAAHYDPKSFEQWKQKFEGDCEQIELMMNHTHVYDLFLNCESSHLDRTVFEIIGQTLLKCWLHALREAFPDKQFKFTYATEPEEYGPTLSFYTEQ